MLLLASALVLAGGASPAGAQDAVTAPCASLVGQDHEFCNLVAHGVQALQSGLGAAVAAGNPVPGTASTLGMRLARRPRLSLDGRLGLAFFDLPPIVEHGSGDLPGLAVPLGAIDVAVGVWPGLSPLPTVGGVLSLDAVASGGLLLLRGGDHFDSGASPFWSVGLRLGLLRESFTLPGVSITAAYRRMGETTWGEPGSTAAYVRGGMRQFGLRAAVTRRLWFVGVTAGAGWDRFSGDVEFGTSTTDGAALGPFRVDDARTERYTFFVNGSYTLLVVHAVAELGWQSHGERLPVPLPAGVDTGWLDGAVFLNLSLRLSI